MKKISLVLLISLISSPMIKAQEKIIELRLTASSVNLNKVPFNKVVLLDNRIDTSKIGTAQTGAFNKIATVRFTDPASVAIQKYIDELIRNAETEPQTLLINLKKLMTSEKTYSMSERGFIDFAAEGYIQRNDSEFVRIFSVDTFYVIKALDVTKAVFSKIPEVIDSMIAQASLFDLSSMDTSKVFSYSEISSGINKHWAEFPVNISPLFTKGVYKSFMDFRNNNIDTINYIITQTDSGTYKVYERNNDKGSKKSKMVKDIWGLNNGTEPYIRINYLFAPLERKNSTFYFIASLKDFPHQTIPEGKDVKMTGLSDGEYYGTLTGLILTAAVNRRSEFYLDMDSGTIVEYKIIDK